MMKFCTVINCMDGRTQIPVIQYLQDRFKADYVDSITEPGPNLVLAEANNPDLLEMILNKVRISIEKHNSSGLAVVGHYDCAGNPAPQEEQIRHINKAIEYLIPRFPGLEIIGLWVDQNLKVCEVTGI